MESELSEFCDELFSFIREYTLSINSHTHHASSSNYVPDELDLLLLRAIENFEDTAGQAQQAGHLARPLVKKIANNTKHSSWKYKERYKVLSFYLGWMGNCKNKQYSYNNTTRGTKKLLIFS